jgi:ribosomal 30S subunit maturation factor RimM
MARTFLGSVGRTHGVKGDFFLRGRQNCLSFSPPLKVEIQDPNGKNLRKTVVLRHQILKDRDLLQLEAFQGGQGVGQLSAILGWEIWTWEPLLQKEADCEHEYSFLKNTDVCDSFGVKMGYVVEFYSFGGGVDQMELEGLDGKKLLIPFVPDYVVSQDTKKILLRVPGDFFEGLWY